VAVDVGAHVGKWTKILTKNHPTVVCFEPDRENFRCLSANFPDVEKHNVALSNYMGRGGLHNPAPENSGAWELVEGSDVDVHTLDSYKLENVAVVKIDAQGSEAAILEGGKETIRREKPTIIIEYILNKAVNKPAMAMLLALGYERGVTCGRDVVMLHRDTRWPLQDKDSTSSK
jgi:FkbM family methyltransferase